MTQVWKDVGGRPVPIGFTSMPIPKSAGQYVQVPQRAELYHPMGFTHGDRSYRPYSVWQTEIVAWSENMSGLIVLKADNHLVPEDLPGWEPLPPWPADKKD
jgi:hypothetical protein